MAIVNPNAIVSGGSGENSGGGTGTTPVTFDVKNLDLSMYTEKVQANLEFIPGATNSVVGNLIQGTVLADEAGNINCFFSVDAGEFAVIVEPTSDTMFFLVFKSDRPTQIAEFNPNTEFPEDVVLFIYCSGGVFNVSLVEGAPSEFVSIPLVDNNGQVSFKRINEKTLEIYYQGVLQKTVNAVGTMGPYLQTLNTMGAMPVPQFSYDLSNAFSIAGYTLPLTLKDGVIYRLLSGGVLFDKVVQMNDFIQFYDNKSNIIITRVPEKVVFPEPIEPEKPIEHFRGDDYTHESQLQNIQNPIGGDYVIYSKDGAEKALYFYDPNTFSWKRAVPDMPTFRGTFPDIWPYIPDAKAGDFIISGQNGEFNLAFYNPFTSGFVSILKRSTDDISEGNYNKYYQDLKVISYLQSLFLGQLESEPYFKTVFENYLQKYISSTRVTYVTVISENVVSKLPTESTMRLSHVEHVAQNISWVNTPDLIYPSDETPTGAFDIWKFDRNLPNKNYWKVEFNVSKYGDDTSPQELLIGLAFNQDPNTIASTIIVKYGNYQTTYWRDVNGDLMRMSEAAFIVKDNKLYVMNTNGEFFEIWSYQDSKLYIFVRKNTASTRIGVNSIKLTVLEEIKMPN